MLGITGIRMGDFLSLKYFQYSVTIIKHGKVDSGAELFHGQGFSHNEVFPEISFTKDLKDLKILANFGLIYVFL